MFIGNLSSLAFHIQLSSPAIHRKTYLPSVRFWLRVKGKRVRVFISNPTFAMRTVPTSALLSSNVSNVGAFPITTRPLSLPSKKACSRGRSKRTTRVMNNFELKKARIQIRTHNLRRHLLKGCLVFQHKDLDLEELRNNPGTRQHAQGQMEQWEKSEEGFIPWTTIHLDCKGRTLMIYYGYRIKDVDCTQLDVKRFPSKERFEQWLKENGHDHNLVNDGMDPTLWRDFWVNTQKLTGIVGVNQCLQDGRHTSALDTRIAKEYYNKDMTQMNYTSNVKPYYLPSGSGRYEAIHKISTEATFPRLIRTNGKQRYSSPVGVLHLFHAWMQQGHKEANPTVSKDLLGSSASANKLLQWYDVQTDDIQSELYEKVFAAFPETAQEYQHTYRVSSHRPEQDRNLFTGHVVVQNTVVHQHRDTSDGGLCVTIPQGAYTGGHLYLPALGIAHMYPPGSIAMFCSQTLYHGVSTWVPDGNVTIEEGLTPGRTSHVFTTHQSIIDWAAKKSHGYCQRTGGGLLPDHCSGNVHSISDTPYMFDRAALLEKAIPINSLVGERQSSKTSAMHSKYP